MAEKNLFKGKLNRRNFLKTGAAGFCSLCLAGIYGCAPEQHDQEKPPEGTPAEISKKGLIKTRLSPWYTELENGNVRCELCPKLCELEEAERAPCRVRENRDGALYSLVYGNPVLVQEDPVERKPFYHVMPGSRALSISTAGCNLACKFCEVWDMALVSPEEAHAYDMPPETVMKHARAGDVRSVSYAFGEPVVYYEYTSKVADLAREAGFLNLMHTAAYIQPEPLQEIITRMDAVNVDLKGFDQEFYREYVGGELETILENLKIIRDAGVHLEITNIVIPTLNDDKETIEEMCKWVANELGTDVPFHFARFYPLHKLSALPRTPASKLDQARKIALDVGLKYVYISRVTGHEGENTFCPVCKEKVIDREGFIIDEIKVDHGACEYCGTDLPGLWA